MNASSHNINKSMQALSVSLVYRLSREENCSNEEALKKLLKSMTYELLQDKESGLYAESPEYVWSMYQDERIMDGRVGCKQLPKAVDFHLHFYLNQYGLLHQTSGSARPLSPAGT